MGIQQGSAFRQKLRQSLIEFRNLEAIQLLKPRFFSPGFFIKIMGLVLKGKYERILKRNAYSQWERMLGIAKGAGISVDFLYFIYAAEMILGVVDYEIPYKGGCTSVLLKSSLMKSNHTTIARNFDYAKFIVPYLCARANQPDGRLKTFDMSAMLLPGTFNGFNEAGVFISTNEAFPTARDIRKPGLSASILIQEALETCQSSDEVANFFKKKPRGSCNIISIADSNDELIVLEYTSKEIHEVYPDDDKDYLIATNHYVTPSLARIDLPRDAVFGKKAPASLRGVVINETSYTRRKTVDKLLSGKKHQEIDDEWLFSLLRDHSANDGKGGMETICHHDPENITAASLVVDLKTKEMFACFGSPCMNEYEKVNFD